MLGRAQPTPGLMPKPRRRSKSTDATLQRTRRWATTRDLGKRLPLQVAMRARGQQRSPLISSRVRHRSPKDPALQRGTASSKSRRQKKPLRPRGTCTSRGRPGAICTSQGFMDAHQQEGLGGSFQALAEPAIRRPIRAQEAGRRCQSPGRLLVVTRLPVAVMRTHAAKAVATPPRGPTRRSGQALRCLMASPSKQAKRRWKRAKLVATREVRPTRLRART